LLPRPVALYTHLATPAPPPLRPGARLPHLPLQLPSTLSPQPMNPLLMQNLSMQPHHHGHCRIPTSADATPVTLEAAPVPLGGTHQDQQGHRLDTGILVKTKQVSEVGGATFCKFRQVKPNGQRPLAGAGGRAKRLNFVQSRWPGPQRSAGVP
ncbi:hypothetical protein BIW11_13146, partial [Tropilaelaps mercedesae]